MKAVERNLSQKAVRMLENLKVKAILLKDISFKTDEGSHIIFGGAEIDVDPERHIGLYNSQHFDVLENEYMILFLN